MRTGNVIELSHGEICHAMHLLGDLPPHEMGVRYAEVYDKLQKRVEAGEIEHEKRGHKSIYRMRLGNGPLPKRFDPNAVVLATGKANPFREGARERAEAVLAMSGQTVQTIWNNVYLHQETLTTMKEKGVITIG